MPWPPTVLQDQPALNTPEWTRRLAPQAEHALSKVRQLYLALYEAITCGDLPANQRLPSSRQLAQQLGVGRNTVIAVFAQLDDEGLIKSAGRGGTRVAFTSALRSSNETAASPCPANPATLSCRSQFGLISGTRASLLAPGMPDANLFPKSAWRKAMACATQLSTEHLGYRYKALPQLQSALARYLAIYRSLNVDPEQIIITSGTRQSLNLAANLYADPGAHAWIESPGYRGAAEAWQLHGLTLHPMRTDDQGCCVPAPDALPQPALIYLTPCFQYPSGVALQASRREQFLATAQSCGAAIFEDDYDSEFRDDSEARPALAAHTHGHNAPVVLHAGTFSKLIFPAARIAWLVVPREHAASAQRCLQMLGGGHNSIAQAIIAELLDNGSVSRHLQKARTVYARRRMRMLVELTHTGLFQQMENTRGSLSMIAHLQQPVCTKALSAELARHSLGVQTLESMRWQCAPAAQVTALVLGLGNVRTLDIPHAIALLAKALTAAARSAVKTAPKLA